MIDECQRMAPLFCIHEAFGEDIRAHRAGELVDELVASFSEALMEPVDVNAVRPAKVSQCWVLARLADLNHGSVVLMKDEDIVPSQESIP